MVEMAEQGETSFPRDLLEEVLTRVTLSDLVPASSVSMAWRAAVDSTLRFPYARAKPCLLLHRQSRRNPSNTTMHIHDPVSHTWILLPCMLHSPTAPLRSSHSTLLYTLSPSKVSFATDPLKTKWIHTCGDGMQVWRCDPIVALIGKGKSTRLVVAGGTCDFEGNPLAVEMYDFVSRQWTMCERMPDRFKNKASATWYSVAVDWKVYVLEKSSGRLLAFDPFTGKWGKTVDIRPNLAVFFSIIVFSGDRLILVGLLGEATNVESLKLWEVDYENDEVRWIGEMPAEMLGKLKGIHFLAEIGLTSIDCSASGNFLYIFNPSDPDEIVCCDLSSGVCEWESIHNSTLNDRTRMDLSVFTCSPIGIDDLRAVFRQRNFESTAMAGK